MNGLDLLKLAGLEKVPDKDENGNDNCDCCFMHKLAYKFLKGCQCPHCKKQFDFSEVPSLFYEYLQEQILVIGEDNGIDPNQQYIKAPFIKCPHCNEHIAFMPQAITWNANHDIYYTGGKSYIPALHHTLPEKVRESIKEKIQQFKDRLLAGENLDAKFPTMWIEGDIIECLATILYENGYKK